VDQVECLVLVALVTRAVATDRRDVQHPCTELNKGASLNWEVEVGDVSESEIDDIFDVLFAEKGGDGLTTIRVETQEEKGEDYTCFPMSSPSLKATNPFSKAQMRRAGTGLQRPEKL
jgi:hypothetical protein